MYMAGDMTDIHTYIHKYIHTYIHTYIHPGTFVYWSKDLGLDKLIPDETKSCINCSYSNCSYYPNVYVQLISQQKVSLNKVWGCGGGC